MLALVLFSFSVEAEPHWAYQPLNVTNPPSVREQEWPRNDIDRFVLAKLDSKRLRPVSDADKAVLIRRAYYDLIGLPPTPEQIDEFLKDGSRDAFAKLVDRLLASPQFGERWGRHWLDLVRFAESVTLRGFIYKEAWRYRDYVIHAFNSDLPYDQFLKEQIAGDLLTSGMLAERQSRLIATTFLALGNTNFEEQDKKQLEMDVVDEQLDTIGKAFLAQTIGCARCHDHKFDPIPTRDYYAIAGILKSVKALEHENVSKWLEFPLPAEPDLEANYKRHDAEVAALQAEIKEAKARAAKSGAPVTGTPVAVSELPGVVVDDSQARRVGEWVHSQYARNYVGDGYVHDGNKEKGAKTITFQPELARAGVYEVRLAYTPASNRATKVGVHILHADGESTVFVNERETPAIGGRFAALGQFRFEANGQGYVLISNEGTDGYVIADAVQFLPAETVESTAAGSGKKVANDELKALETKLKQVVDRGPKRPMFMSVKEGEIGDTHVHIRGTVNNLGEKVPRGFLGVATPANAPSIPENESGRRELGEWLASRDNPLTARVVVNRAGHWLFGAGLVRTTDNFGTTGEQPSHPELLDHLAMRFMDEGWSVKRLVRLIVLSRTYQLSTDSDSAALDADPENRLLWRMNRKRLDAECIRDSMLSVSRQLTLDIGGATIKAGTSADYGYRYTDPRRSVYVPVLRNALPELFEAFDFADPSAVTGRRNVSTVAPQALFLMNHPFVIEQSDRAAKHLLQHIPCEARIDYAYRLTLGRSPTDGERALTLQNLDGSEDLRAWAQLFQALFASIDFRYLN